MRLSKAEQRQIENEMIFRRMNEKVGFDLDALDDMHREDGNPHLLYDDNLPLQFKCECSDEECNDRLPLKLSRYREIHVDRNTFIVKPGHQIDSIEKVMQEEDGYIVVKKNNSTPEPNDVLKNTRGRKENV